MKTIHFGCNTATGPFSSKSDHASYHAVECDQTEACDFYRRGQCAKLGMFSNCPYGKYCRVTGPTRRARSYHEFLNGAREKYKGIPSLNHVSGTLLAIVGDYVYLPLSYLKNYVNSVSTDIKYGHFVLRSDLTPAFIAELCRFRPEALFGGEIKDYQKNLFVFLRGMRDRLPELLAAAIALDPTIERRMTEVTNVGRKATLETLAPNVGEFVDIHKGHWTWDGEWLTSKDSHANFMLANQFSEIRVKPIPGHTVVITHDAQVTDKTVFVD